MLACFLVVFSVSSGVSAVDGEAVTQNYDDFFTTTPDLFSYEADQPETFSTPDAWAYVNDPQSKSISTFALSSLNGPHYTFDISKIDWYTNAPSQVRAVYDMDILNGTASRQMPFVAVYVTSNDSAQVIVGVNVGFFVRWDSASYMKNPRLCVGYITRNDFSTHYLYSATFNKNGAISTPWYQMTVSDQGSTGLIKYYTGWATPSHTRDIFAYGVNACSVRPSGYSDNALVYFPESDGGTYTVTTFYNSASGGFRSSVFPSSSFVTQYFPNISMQSFSVPTFEEMQAIKQEQQHEETKGLLGSIIDKIKEIPTLIINGLKSLFVPSDGFFSAYFDELNNFFKDRFGFLYELPAFVVTLFQKLIDFNPDTSDYSMTFPKFQAPEVVNGDVVWHDVSEEQTFNFTFLDEEPFKTLYSVYKSLIWLAYCILLLNLIKRKSESVFGGGTE